MLKDEGKEEEEERRCRWKVCAKGKESTSVVACWRFVRER